MSGSASERVAVVTARVRSFPVLMCSIDGPRQRGTFARAHHEDQLIRNRRRGGARRRIQDLSCCRVLGPTFNSGVLETGSSSILAVGWASTPLHSREFAQGVEALLANYRQVCAAIRWTAIKIFGSTAIPRSRRGQAQSMIG